MQADQTDPGRREPQCLQRRAAPAATRGLHPLVVKSGREEQIATEPSAVDALVNSAPTAAFAGAFLGCLTTLHFGAGGFVPAIASALATTLLCGPLLITRTTSLFPGELFVAIYGGSFAGMTPVLGLHDTITAASVMPATALFILLSIVSGLAFCLVAEIDARSGRRLAGGCGGRSGAIATVASFLFVAAASLFGADGPPFRAARADLLAIDPRSLALTFAACVVGMSVTLAALRQRRVASAGPAERIFIAAAVALIGMMILYLNDASDTHGLDAFYAGCFLGMSTPERLKGWIQPVLGVILLTAMLVVVKTLLPDIGGGLGFAAFVAVVVLQAPSRLTTWTKTWTKTSLTTSNRTRKRLQTGTLASARVSPIPEMPIRGAAIAASLASLLVMGWFAMPHQVASEQPGLNMASAPVVVPTAQILEQVALVQGKPNSVDEATPIGLPPGTASADAVNPDPALSLELNVRDILAAHGVSADTRAEAGRADLVAGAATQTTEAVQSETRIDAATQSNDEIFREFVQWRAERYNAMARPRPQQPVKRSHNPAFQVVRLTPPASIRTAPRAPTRTPAIRPAPVQARP
jgi:hypothetical protein